MGLVLDLSGRHALVCGASKGIGRATALALAAAGARVTALARSVDLLGELVDSLRADGCDADAVVADLDDTAHLGTAIDQVLDARGPVHVLVNNTGGPPGGRLLDAPFDALLAALRRHLGAAHLLVQRVVPGMDAARYGRIVNVVSTSVKEPIPNLGVSNTTRAAVAGWAKTLSRELPAGVTINNVLPGYTATARLDELRHATAARLGTTPDAVEAAWKADIPEGRLGRADEVAAVIAFLASPAGSYVRGQSIAVDGGRMRSI